MLNHIKSQNSKLSDVVCGMVWVAGGGCIPCGRGTCPGPHNLVTCSGNRDPLGPSSNAPAHSVIQSPTDTSTTRSVVESNII